MRLPSKLIIDYRLFVGMLLVDRLSFFLVYQNLLILGDFLVDSLVGCYWFSPNTQQERGREGGRQWWSSRFGLNGCTAGLTVMLHFVVFMHACIVVLCSFTPLAVSSFY